MFVVAELTCQSLTVIKSDGYKISAPDIVLGLLNMPSVADFMAVGVPDEEYGQRVESCRGDWPRSRHGES